METDERSKESGNHHGYFAAISGLPLEAFIEGVREGYAEACAEGNQGKELDPHRRR